MANVKFTEFPSATTVGSTDIIPIVQSGANKKATVAVFSTYIGSAFVALTGNQTVAGVKTFSSQLASSVATGTAPFSIASTTKVTNLNADLLDGYTSGDFQLALTNPVTGTGTTNYLPKFTGTSSLGDSNLISNSAGNLGVGVTPSTATGFRYIQFGAGAALSTNNTNNSNFWHNTNFDASGNALYAVTGQQSSFYRQINGIHVWATAPSGTAGNAITFTQNMVLDASGRLGIGTTAPSSLLQLEGATPVFTINKTSGTSLGANFKSSGTSVAELTANTSSGEFKISSGFSSYGGFLTFNTDGSERMRIFSNGNIGINTTTDAGYKLDVNGTARVSGALTISSGNEVKFYRGDNAIYTRLYDVGGSTGFVLNNMNSDGFSFQNGGVTKLRIDASGAATFNSGTTNQNTKIFGNKVGMSRTSDGAEVVYFSKNTDLGTEGTANINGYDGIQFRTQGAESVKAVITSAGNVGINTTAPNAKLDVRDSNKVFDGYGNVNIFTSDSFAENIGGSIAFGGASNGGTSPYPFAKIQGYKEGSGSWSGSLIFGTTQSNSALTEKMRITSAGNVGIGTTNPSQKLHLYTASASSIYTRIENANGNTYLGLSAGGDTILSADTAGNNLLLYTAATERMRILSNGQLAVNTTSPDASALVQIDSNTQGFLVPRMLESEINSISSPAAGLMVYNTDQNHMCMFDGSVWKKLSMSNM